MATAAMAGAAGAAVVMYYTGWGIPWGVFGGRSADDSSGEGTSEEREGDLFVRGIARDVGKRRVVVPVIARAPCTWFEALSTISETLRFTYSETLGKWPIGDLAFGINYLLRRQGNEDVAQAFASEGSQELHGPEVLADMKEYRRLLIMCMHFSKKPFPGFLKATGLTPDQVLLEEGKAGLLKPAFTVLLDHEHCCILLLIRGTHSVKDTLTSMTGAVVPFHHTVLGQDGVSNLVLGYAHCGMVAAARWISQKASEKLLQAQKDHPGYQIKIVGHSLGGGTAALLSYILRERNDFASVRCVSFAPAACMTRELAESGNIFVNTIINGCDLVPCFSSGSLDELRAEVTASAWVSDFREQIERTRILRTVYRSASALSSRLQSIASLSRSTMPYSLIMVSRAAQTGAAGAGAIWRPVSTGTQVILRQALAVVKRPSLMNWASPGPHPAAAVALVSTETQTPREAETSSSDTSSASAIIQEQVDDRMLVHEIQTPMVTNMEGSSSPSTTPFEPDVDQLRAGELLKETMETGFDSTPIIDGSVEDLPPVLSEAGIIRDAITELQMQEELDQSEITSSSTASGEEVQEDILWHQVAQELERQRQQADEENQRAREEEEAVAREITQEEEHVASAVASEIGTDRVVPAVRVDNRRHFYPPGLLMHMVGPGPLPMGGNSHSESDGQGPNVVLYSTQRTLYAKIRLSRTMVHDHYMPTYKRMMEALIEQLEKELCDWSSEVQSLASSSVTS